MMQLSELIGLIPGITPGATRQNVLVVLLVGLLGSLLVVGLLMFL